MYTLYGEELSLAPVLGEADRVDGLVRRIFAQLGYEAPVIATGGLASVVARHSDTIDEVNPELTLEGLRLLAEKAAADAAAARKDAEGAGVAAVDAAGATATGAAAS